MTLISLSARRSARTRPYLRALERRRATENHAFHQFVETARAVAGVTR